MLSQPTRTFVASLVLALAIIPIASCGAPVSDSGAPGIVATIALQSQFEAGNAYKNSDFYWIKAPAANINAWMGRFNIPNAVTLPCTRSCYVVETTGHFALNGRTGGIFLLIMPGSVSAQFDTSQQLLKHYISLRSLGQSREAALPALPKIRSGRAPDLVGLSSTEAVWLASKLQLNVTTYYVTSHTDSLGTIVSESPRPGLRLQGRPLSLGIGIPLPVHRGQPTPSPTSIPSPVTAPVSCKDLPSSRYSDATASSASFEFAMVAVPAPPNDPWASLKDRYAVPPDWESYVPHVPVTNATHGEVSNCEANLWAYGLMKSAVLSDWASEWGAPLLETSTATIPASAIYGGQAAVQVLDDGGTQVEVGGVFPERLTLVPISLSDDETLLAPSAFAFVAQYVNAPTELITTSATGATQVKSVSPSGPQIIAGNYDSNFEPEVHASDWQFGPLWNITGFYSCSSDHEVTESLCRLAHAG